MKTHRTRTESFVPSFRRFCMPATGVLWLACITTASGAQTIEKFTVTRNDEFHESWPDLVIAANGDFVLTYQESESHGGGPVSTIVTRVSTDQGRTWSERTVVAQLGNRRRDGWLNCSRVSAAVTIPRLLH